MDIYECIFNSDWHILVIYWPMTTCVPMPSGIGFDYLKLSNI